MSAGAATRPPSEVLVHPPRPHVHGGSASLENTIARRRSVREFAHELLTSTQLSQLLWAAQGPDRGDGDVVGLRPFADVGRVVAAAGSPQRRRAR